MARADPLISLADYERAAEGLLEPICQSTFADVGVSELAQAAPESSRWFRLYVFRDRALPSLAWADIVRFASDFPLPLVVKRILAVGDADGAQRVLEILLAELDTALARTGVARLAALDRGQLRAAPWAAEH
jgi:isopentenyl diphosphate isomerase/L-lactate dehydrogenase-like FMN-dependent dehydrogenase